jgi:hypothetical protein
MEDFKTFVLPTPQEWTTASSGMSREQKVTYLGTRLRLLNCFQLSQPGDVDFTDAQRREPGMDDEGGQAGTAVINPYVELLNMKLAATDLKALAPLLLDENFLPTYSYWRSFHPDRNLHQVNRIVAALINDVAHRQLADLSGWERLSPQEKQRRADVVVEFARKFDGKSVADILRENLQTDDARDWFRSAQEAADSRDASLLEDLIGGAKKFPEEKPRIAELCYRMGAPEAVKIASFWLPLKNPNLKFYCSLILARHGDAEARTKGLAALKEVMAGRWDEGFQVKAIEPMLEAKNAAVTEIACQVLRRKELDWGLGGGMIAHRLFLTKHPAALEALVAGLADDSGAKPEEGEWEGATVKRQVCRGDRVAAEVAMLMRKDYEYELLAPDDLRKAARGEIAKWLKEQAELLAAGKPTPELNLEAVPVQPGEWKLDAP